MGIKIKVIGVLLRRKLIDMNLSLLKDQLVFKDFYRWNNIPDGDPRVSGELEHIPFEPEDGDQVLYFINKLLSIWSFDEMTYARKIEKMIKVGISKDIKTQIEAKNWIKDNWINY